MENNLMSKMLFEIQIIHPLEIIMMQLDKGNLKDTDVKYLNHKLTLFIKLAEIAIQRDYPPGFFHFSIHPDDRVPTGVDSYGYVYNYYNKYFGKLLKYFKSYNM